MDKQLIKKVKDAIKQIEPTAEIILYGSRARRDAKIDSDWDFLILVDGLVDAARTDRIRHSLYKIEWETDQIISSIVRNRHDWNGPKYVFLPLHREIEREGIHL